MGEHEHKGYYTKKLRSKRASDPQKQNTYFERVFTGSLDFCCSFCGRARAEKLEGTNTYSDKIMIGIPRGRALMSNAPDTPSNQGAPTQSSFVARRPLTAGTRRRSLFLREKQALAARKASLVESTKNSQRSYRSSTEEVLEVSEQSAASEGETSDVESLQIAAQRGSRSRSQPHDMSLRAASISSAGRVSTTAASRLLAQPSIRDKCGQIVPGLVSDMRKKRIQEQMAQLQGYLLKGSKSITGFEKRWFRMSEDAKGNLTLQYFVNHVEAKNANGVPRGEIPMLDVVEIKKDAKYEKQFLIVRQMDHKKQRTYILKAKDFTIRDHWVTKLILLQKEMDPTYDGGN